MVLETRKGVGDGVEMTRDVEYTDLSLEGNEEIDTGEEEGIVKGASTEGGEEVDRVGVVREYENAARRG